jgi:hypothetical protein
MAKIGLEATDKKLDALMLEADADGGWVATVRGRSFLLRCLSLCQLLPSRLPRHPFLLCFVVVVSAMSELVVLPHDRLGQAAEALTLCLSAVSCRETY